MPTRVTANRCVPVDNRVDLLVTAVTEIQESGGASYTAGDGIDATQLAGGVIQTSIDGVSIVFDGGVMKAVAASDLIAGPAITIAGGEVSANVDGTTIDIIGNNLTVIAFAFGTIHVAGEDDVVAATPSDDWTLAAGSNVAITTNAGTKTITIASSDTDTTYTAGAGVNLSGTKFVADPNTASHVGLVDPASGDDSSSDDAQIGVLWHGLEDYDVTENMLIGHEANDSTKPVVCYKTVADWLKTLPDYSSTTPKLLFSDGEDDGDEVRWATISEVLTFLAGYDLDKDMSIGKDAGDGPEWQEDTDECPE